MAQPERLHTDDLTGRQFDGYRLLNRISIGGSGAVYRAQHRKYSAPVAMKLMHYDRNKRETAAFRREFVLGKMLSANKFFLHYYDKGSYQNRPYTVMEYFPGKPLGLVWREGEVKAQIENRLSGFWVELAQAVEYLHRHKIVHWDLKPNNFLYDGRLLKLIDFSISEVELKWWQLWLPGERKGTPGYMSSEQIQQKKPATVMDIYGFGAMMFEYFAGRLPFVAEDSNTVLNMTLKTPTPPKLSKFNPRVSNDLEKLVGRMLAKDPKMRPRNMQQIIAALKVMDFYVGEISPQ
ncbi:hypothetical protein FACS1894139_16240 [Planctomycetales bacterium]|nr:hypothetical protein FACS1894107_10710 [Planctomycetales bacterium]GHS99559.1 hypothetical protein FACS1894108_09770 [Planctomycetales bacterium]GHT07634.1 hypothetical protein FACS1894139_16240 [Planctomycetales bacterium]GHV23102.1 hypothetical protein AGMMS49959_15220 [Planctomycetales bacterium]